MSLPKWLSGNPRKAKTLGERICEGLREIGVLLIAFAPLDIGLKERKTGDPSPFLTHWKELLAFVGIGLFLWLVGVVSEWAWRRYDDD